MLRGSGSALLIGAGIVLALVVLLLTLLLSVFSVILPAGALGDTGGLATSSTDWRARGPLASVVTAAETLQYHISGPLANEYDLADPVMQRVYAFWVASCGTNGQVCSQAVSGNLQCVLFVTAAFALGGDPLPVAGNGEDFWTLYQGRAGWSEIRAGTGLPQPGDLMIWRGGKHLESGTSVEFGHIAVIVRVIAPSGGQDGSITVAEANMSGNRFPHSGASGNFYTLPLHTNWQVDSWPGFVDAQGVSYSGYQVIGYLRQLTPPTFLLPDGIASTPTMLPDAHLAWQSAITEGINPVYFLRQLLLPGLSSVATLDSWDASSAFRLTAALMAQYHQQEEGDDAKALAAYQSRPQVVQEAVARCGDGWFACLPIPTQQYVRTIVGP